MKRNLVIFLVSCSLTVPPLWSQAQPKASSDEITFLNGDKLTGRVKQINDVEVLFRADVVGEITVPIEKIGEMRHEGYVVPIHPSHSSHLEILTQVSLVKLDGLSVTQAASSKKYPCTWKAMNKKGILYPSWWRIGVSTGQGLSWVYATQGQQTLGGSLDLGFCEGSLLNNTTLLLGGTHTRSSKIGSPAITGDISNDSLIQKHMFTKPSGFGIYGIADAFLNNSLGLVLQKSFGIGLLAPEFGDQTFSYSAMADVRYINQRFYGVANATNLAGIRLEENANYTKSAFGFNEEFWIIPTFNDVHALQMFATGGPSLTLSPWLCISVNEEEHYLGDAPHGKRKNYLASTVKLTLQHKSSACK
jgi:hypothetical protein